MEDAATPVAVTTVAVRAIDHLVLNVRDVEATVAWYRRVLGMTRHDFGGPDLETRRTALVFGSQKINVRPIGADRGHWFTAKHATAGSDDLCFLTDAEPLRVVAHLRACGVPIELGPVDKDGARGHLRSVYCRDPDGNLIEISSYP